MNENNPIQEDDLLDPDYFIKVNGKVVGIAAYTKKGTVSFCPFWTGEDETSTEFPSMEAVKEHVDSFEDDPLLEEWLKLDVTFEAVYEDGERKEVELHSLH